MRTIDIRTGIIEVVKEGQENLKEMRAITAGTNYIMPKMMSKKGYFVSLLTGLGMRACA